MTGADDKVVTSGLIQSKSTKKKITVFDMKIVIK